MQFAYPWVFWGLLALPLFWLCLLLWRRFGRSQKPKGLPLPHLHTLKPLKRSWRSTPWLRYVSHVLLTLCFVGLIAALARPRTGETVQKSKVRGVDIMLAVDTSLSMLAEDLKPNRLEVAKQVIQKFIGVQAGNRLGVVVFAGQSYTLLPLSTDYAMVSDSIEEIEIDMIEKGGTAIGDAIANAVYRFRDDNPKSRVMILLTDGEKTEGIDPIGAAKAASQRGVKIHTIGLGKLEGAPIPVIDRFTGRRTYARDGRGNLYISRLKGDDLKKISELTGGQFFRADSVDTLERIYARINAMEKAEFETRSQTVFTEQMHWFLLPALGCLILGLFLRLQQPVLR